MGCCGCKNKVPFDCVADSRVTMNIFKDVCEMNEEISLEKRTKRSISGRFVVCYIPLDCLGNNISFKIDAILSCI